MYPYGSQYKRRAQSFRPVKRSNYGTQTHINKPSPQFLGFAKVHLGVLNPCHKQRGIFYFKISLQNQLPTCAELEASARVDKQLSIHQSLRYGRRRSCIHRHHAVLFERCDGVLDSTAGEGMHLYVPWLRKPFVFDVRTRRYVFSSVSGWVIASVHNLLLLFNVLTVTESFMIQKYSRCFGEIVVSGTSLCKICDLIKLKII